MRTSAPRNELAPTETVKTLDLGPASHIKPLGPVSSDVGAGDVIALYYLLLVASRRMGAFGMAGDLRIRR